MVWATIASNFWFKSGPGCRCKCSNSCPAIAQHRCSVGQCRTVNDLQTIKWLALSSEIQYTAPPFPPDTNNLRCFQTVGYRWFWWFLDYRTWAPPLPPCSPCRWLLWCLLFSTLRQHDRQHPLYVRQGSGPGTHSPWWRSWAWWRLAHQVLAQERQVNNWRWFWNDKHKLANVYGSGMTKMSWHCRRFWDYRHKHPQGQVDNCRWLLDGKDVLTIEDGFGRKRQVDNCWWLWDGFWDWKKQIIDSCITCNVSSATKVILGQNIGHTN